MEYRGIIGKLLTKIFLLVSRSRLLGINNTDSTETQKIQVSNLSKEIISDIERYQEYGFENYPIIPNAEAVNLFINGNRNSDKGINIVINNRKLRPTDLSSGEVCIYCKDSNNSNDNRIWLKPTNNEIEIKTADGNDIIIDSNGINITDANSNTIVMKNTGVEIDGALIKFGTGAESYIKGDTCKTELDKESANMIALKAAITGWVPVPNDGGAALQAALAAFLALPTESYANILSSKISGE